jgi:phosphoserine/homoserine phosphotransferase
MGSQLPGLVTADLEGVFIPEVWVAVAKTTGIERLELTTRDIVDYNELMNYRLTILREHNLTLGDIQSVLERMEPLPRAVDFINWMRERTQLIILTDSFYQFVEPFMPKLEFPTIFAHQLVTDDQGMITGYHLRCNDSKRRTVEVLRETGFRILSFGDSYNDTTMLNAADQGVLFRPPENVIADFPHFPVANRYDELRTHIERFLSTEG